MPRYRDEPPAVRVYTVCDESRYLIVRNVPALGCGDDLMKLFATYGDVEECKPMDAEDCEPFTDVYWLKFRVISNARFAKKKLDESVFLGNRLQVSYAPQFEGLEDTKEKLETRRKEVLARLDPHKSKGSHVPQSAASSESSPTLMQFNNFPHQSIPRQRVAGEQEYESFRKGAPVNHITTDKEYFTSPSMNQAVRMVRDKLNKSQESNDQKRIQSQTSNQHQPAEPAPKRTRVDNRRRI